MRVVVEGYEHRTGEHCASTALRNILHFHGEDLSEAMIVGLANGLGFLYLRSDSLSPTRMFHGRTATLELDFCANTGIPFDEPRVSDDERGWRAVKDRIDAGEPVLVSTDTFYLGYHRTTSHFPGHRAVVVGYDEVAGEVLIADRKFPEYQVCSLEELRRSRNARDYPMRCDNQYGDFRGPVRLGRPLHEAVRIALQRNCAGMLTSGESTAGVAGMRRLADDFGSWQHLEDWSWAARFGYQVVVKRGAGGHFFRSLYADFLDEAAELLPALRAADLPERMHGIATSWRDFAAILEEQSEIEACRPELFVRAGAAMGELADAEESFFRDLARLA